MITTKSKRRMLFLHGMFVPPKCYEKVALVDFMDALKKSDNNDWEVVFVESPRDCPDTPPAVMFDFFPRELIDRHPEWVNSHANDDGTKTYNGLKESLSFLQSFLKKEPKFDVISGHSNGALMASILSLMIEADPSWLDSNKHWSASLLWNAPGSYETETTMKEIIAKLDNGPVITQTQSIHVWGGPSDVSWEGEQKLKHVHHPDNSVVIQHTSGHFFPPKDEVHYDQIVQSLDKISYR